MAPNSTSSVSALQETARDRLKLDLEGTVEHSRKESGPRSGGDGGGLQENSKKKRNLQLQRGANCQACSRRDHEFPPSLGSASSRQAESETHVRPSLRLETFSVSVGASTSMAMRVGSAGRGVLHWWHSSRLQCSDEKVIREGYGRSCCCEVEVFSDPGLHGQRGDSQAAGLPKP